MGVPIGQGTVLSVSTSTGSLDIAKITDISGPDSAAEVADVTSFGDTFRQYVGGGPIDPGEVSIETFYSTTVSIDWLRLPAYQESGAAKTFTVNFSTTDAGDTQTFSAIVTGIGQAIPMSEGVKRTVTLRITGDPGFST